MTSKTSAFVVPSERFTIHSRANAGEVMPDPVSPLSGSWALGGPGEWTVIDHDLAHRGDRYRDLAMFVAGEEAVERDRLAALEVESVDQLANRDTKPIEYRMYTAAGKLVWMLDEAVLEADSNGVPVWHGVLYEVSERKRTELALQAARDALQSMLDDERPIVVERAADVLRVAGWRVVLDRREATRWVPK